MKQGRKYGPETQLGRSFINVCPTNTFEVKVKDECLDASVGNNSGHGRAVPPPEGQQALRSNKKYICIHMYQPISDVINNFFPNVFFLISLPIY